jgi:hypothetical protein
MKKIAGNLVYICNALRGVLNVLWRSTPQKPDRMVSFPVISKNNPSSVNTIVMRSEKADELLITIYTGE